MQKRWVLKENGSPDVVKHLSEELNISEILSNLLVQRGITTFDESKDFFRPEIIKLHDPFLMKDMDIAVERIERAIRTDEKILVYGDYDVDGTSSVALVYSFLNKALNDSTIPNKIGYYIPDRYTEGYGVSFLGIDFAKDNGFSLIICLDCGIKAVEKIRYAREKGIDFIVCDHHLPGYDKETGNELLPDAIAILDPKRKDCNYPFDELSGCGIGFKLMHAYSQKNNIPFRELEQCLDLTAISIASDIVPIIDENRILTHFGLKRINEKPRPGIKAILDLNNIKKKLTVNNLVFIIGPRINAAGRIDSGRKAVELLLSVDDEAAYASGRSIDINNTERRNIDAHITLKAIEMIERDSNLIDRKTTVLFDPGWHKGVIGIVASRVIEKYYRPTIILTKSNGMATGSARTVKNFNVYQAIEACSDLLEQFGGHKYAAGLTLKMENLPAFKEKFERIVSDMIDDSLLVPEVEIDAEIKLSDITQNFFNIINQFAPFGPMNMMPVFKTCNVVDKGFARIVGNNHLKINIIDQNSSNPGFSAIAFKQGEHLKTVSQNAPFDICYTIEENEWNGVVSLQLNIKDIRAAKL
ncbi:MAG: single-stranded-DNA-specific exonuclease RecJ [Bacteroidota bacterium]